MYKTIWAADDLLFDKLLSDAEKDGFTVVSFAPHWRFLSETSEYKEFKQTIFTALMHRPDAAPSPFMTANDFLAAMDASVEIMQSMADHADEVLRDEARQHGVGQ